MSVKKTPQTKVLQQGHPQPCLLTWYDPALGGTNSSSGRPDPHGATASGEAYDPAKDTCAAPPNYPFGTMITFFYSGRSVVCRVNDRGGAIQGSHFDLSRHAAETLGIISAGSVSATFIVGGATAGAFKGATTSATGTGSGGGGPSSILDILTAPMDMIGGWLAGIALNLTKDLAIAIGDVIIVPFWHWNQRAVMAYYQDLTSKDKSWPMIPWTAAFWGLGYWLLFTDPDAKNLKPASVQRSRAARHVRGLQALPARRELIKPGDVGRKTPDKPKPVVSRAPLVQVDTMQTTRPQKVRVTRAGNGEPQRSEVRVREAESIVAGSPAKHNREETETESRKSHSHHRARTHSPEGSGGVTTRNPAPSGRNGSRA